MVGLFLFIKYKMHEGANMKLLTNQLGLQHRVFMDQLVFGKETKLGLTTTISSIVVIEKREDVWTADVETEIINKATERSSDYLSVMTISEEDLVFFIDDLERKGFARII